MKSAPNEPNRLVGLGFSVARRAGQPMLLAQATTSAYGVVSTLIAVSILSVSAFVVFTIFTLAQGLIQGVQRSLLLDPALVSLRRDPDCRPRLIHLAAVLIIALPLNFFVCLISGHATVAAALALTFVTPLPLLHDFLRYRAMAAREFHLVLISDLVRFAGVASVSVVAVFGTANFDSASFQVVLLSCAAPAAITAAWSTSVRRRSSTSYRSLRVIAGWQFLDYAVSQVQTTGPLLLIASQATTPLVGAFRLAQTLMGPVNLILVALSVNFLARSATSSSTNDALISFGIASARRITGLTCLLVVGAVGLVLLDPGLFPAVSSRDLVVATVCVGAAACTSASAGIHSVLLRTLFHQQTVAYQRIALVAMTWTGFGIGYAFAGVGGSLVFGFLAAAVANPFAVNLSARYVYRRQRSTGFDHAETR